MQRILVPLLFLFAHSFSVASLPVPYTGKISIRGANYFGEAQFRFSLHNGQGTTYWQNGEGVEDTIQVPIRNGRYHVLLGGQGMTPLPPELFLDHEELYLRVELELEEGEGFEHLAPDQVITATPRALVAEWAKMAKVSERVSPGAITRSMLSPEVLADLNQTVADIEPSPPSSPAASSITREMLAADLRNDLNRTITPQDLSPEVNASIYALIDYSRLSSAVRADLNKTITYQDLSPQIKADLNRTISKRMLGQDVLSDLNRTITHTDLSPELKVDLNRTITPQDLSPEVNASIHALIDYSRLSSAVRADLNKTITYQDLSPQIKADLNRTISKQMLGQDVLSDLNRTITHTDLSPELKVDLNRTVTPQDLSPEVNASIHALIDYSRLSSAVRADLNKTITHQDLSPQIKADLNRTISKQMLGQDVLSDLNRTITPQMLQPSSITTAQLNEQILKYLRPEVLQSPEAPGLVFHGQRVILQTRAEGKYLSYQWYKDGQAIPGATQKRYIISDVNGTLHDGNYSLVVSNDFGSVTTPATELQVDSTPPHHTVASIGLEMIFCPPGTFTRGSPANEPGRVGDETPHTVTLTHGFYLGKYEVTQAQYQTVMNGNSESLSTDPSQFKGSNRPVENVSWADAQVFLAQLNAIEQTAGRLPAGWEYALPTEAQWEYACRAGTSTAYSWGNDINSSRANYNWDGAYNTGSDFKQTREVGQYGANPWGFFDMHGNAWEWVHDWKANYPGGALTDPVGPASGSHRVARGGSWSYVGTILRSARRDDLTPSHRGHSLGFRVGFQAVQPDTADPEVELFGGAGFTQEAGQAWAEPGAAGHDLRDGNLTDAITITGTVDVNTPGTYLLTYTVVDAAGNSDTATRTVTVADTTAPVLSLVGAATSTHFKGLTWVDPGATATDTLDGNLTDAITPIGTVDVNSTGAYTLTYTVSDAAGNEANVTRTVNVGLPATYATDLNASVSLEMIWVQPGTFVMGSPTTETGRQADRETEHNVTLTQGFYLGKYEVTQAQYEAVTGSNPSEFNATGNGDRPVEDLNWTEALAFCEQLTIRERNAGRIPADWAYVLPTESQWEYACRAGTTTVYSWGDDINSSHANYSASGVGETEEVGQYAANPWGFFDMHGNVWEWTADWYAVYPSDNPTIDPTGPASGSDRVLRGGSWYNVGSFLRSAKRYNLTPSTRYNNLGFRVGFQKQ